MNASSSTVTRCHIDKALCGQLGLLDLCVLELDGVDIDDEVLASALGVVRH